MKFLRRALFAVALLSLMGRPVQAVPTHPLDPLDKDEMGRAVAILKADGKLNAGSRFALLTLQEPAKADVLNWHPGAPLIRRASAIILDKDRNQTFRAVIDVTDGKVESWTELPGVQPAVLIQEFDTAPKIVRKDPRFIAAMQRRGIKDMDEVQIDAWAAGYRTDADSVQRRLIRCIFFYRGKDGHDPYPQPIEGVMALVDMNHDKVLELTDTGLHTVLPNKGNLDEKSIAANYGPLRQAPRPLLFVQPQGPSFQIHGHEVTWQKWHFRWAMHPREGLMLYNVAYHDKGRLRPILYRASLSEMVVPYGDPDGNWTFRNAFDVGEYGVGRLADTLEPGKDAPNNAVYMDATFADDMGKAYVDPKCVGLYETDGDILWKHFDFETNHSETRRARKLVLMMVATVGNYDYSYNWIFNQDGSIEFKTLATGIDLTKGVDEATCQCVGTTKSPDEKYGTLIAHHVVAPNHQHWFNMRLDFDVDGTRNSVYEVNVNPAPPGPDNPYLNAFSADETVLKTPREAERDLNLATQRTWMVVNPNVKNDLGQPVAYMIAPQWNSLPYVQPGSPIRTRAGFIDHHFWATPYDPTQMYGGGDFPNQRAGADGLPVWANSDASIENQDVVVWYTFGLTHIPRPEDYPVMGQTSMGFRIVPFGFFDHEPALDVPGTPVAPKKPARPKK